MPDATEGLRQLEEGLSARTRGHREFFLPIIRAIAALGGRAGKADVVRKVRELLTDHLSEKQLDYLENKNRFGWARKDLKDLGIIGGQYGYWELTDLGRAYADAHADGPIDITVENLGGDGARPLDRRNRSRRSYRLAGLRNPTAGSHGQRHYRQR